MLIVDCFIFSYELDLLKFRLKELNDVVDYFVLVEATHTHSGWHKQEYGGVPKKLVYNENKHLFEEYKDKLIHIIVDDLPTIEQQWRGEWEREFHQRRAITRGLDQLPLQDNDIILINDCDEIPNSDLLKQFKIHNGFNIFEDKENLIYLPPHNLPHIDDIYSNEFMGLIYDFYYYNLECKNTRWWWFSKALTYRKLKEIGDIQQIRMWHNGDTCYFKAGWHLSFFGGIDAIVQKIETYTHQEHNNDYILNKERIQKQIDNFKDIFERPEEVLERIPIEENNFLPKNYKMLL